MERMKARGRRKNNPKKIGGEEEES